MDRPVRNVFFWCHLIAGLGAGLVILVMAVTGTLLTYEAQIVDWAERGLRSTPPSAEARRLSLEALLARAEAAEPATPPSGVTLAADPAAPVLVQLGRERTLFIDAYTGELLGEGAPRLRAAFRTLIGWHRWLGAAGEGRDTARAVTAACNLAFLFLVFSGAYLWIPRRLTWRQLRNVGWLRRGLRGKARDFNWHNVIGLWCALPLAVVVGSGVFISYPWATDLVYRLTGEERPAEPRRERPGPAPRERAEASPETRPERAPAPPTHDGLNELWAVAAAQFADWQTVSLRLPRDAAEPVAFTILRGSYARPDLRARLTLDRATAAVVERSTYADQAKASRVRSWARWLHTGEAGGVLGQTLAGLASAGGAFLVWTGFALSWRRFGLGRLFERRLWQRRRRPDATIQESER